MAGSELTRRGFLGAGALGASLLGGRARAADPGGTPADRVPVEMTVNGAAVARTVHPDDSALELLRDLGATAAKLGCGHGACGACTVWCGGRTTTTCLLPATALHRQEVRTLEGIGPALHPVQRAFLAEDALQCGYCTPGFVVEAIDFVDRWRAERGAVEPDDASVQRALSGHICRCGAHAAILRAVKGAAAGRFDGEGGARPRAEGLEKVTGRARYTVDVRLPDQLVGAVLRCPWGAATLEALDVEAARAVPGVRAVLRQVPDGGALRYAGQEVAALAADDRHAAEAGLRALAPRYAVQRPAIGLDEALAPDAPVVWAKRERKGAPIASEAPPLPAPWEASNLRGPTRSDWFSAHERADREIEGAATVVRGTWRTAAQAHTTLEPHAAVARVDGPRLEVWASTQGVLTLQEDLAERTGRRREDVVVHAEHVGGGFGGKAGFSPEIALAVDLAEATGRPVGIALERHEELAVGGYRPAQRVDLALAADAEGALAGLTSDAYADQGVAVGTITGFLMRLMYPSRVKRLRDFDVLTNGAPGKPFRAPGGPPAFVALEGAIDAMAAARGEDPLALRRRWDENPHRQRLYAVVADLPLWRDRTIRREPGRFQRGVGLASATWFAFSDRNTRVELDWDGGRLVARTAAQDMGNGTRSAIAWAVGARLGLDPREVAVEIGDSRLPYGPLSAGSRTTASVVPAAEDAVDALIDELAAQARARHGRGEATPEGWRDEGGGVRPWAELLAQAARTRVIGRRRRDPAGHFLPFGLQGTWVSKELPGAVQVTEVEVDTRLGRVRATQAWVGIAVGRVVAPPLARSQVEGGVIQGLGYALYEDRRLDRATGALLTSGLEDYRVPGIGDIPAIEVHFDEGGFEGVAGGFVGLSELAGSPCAASVAAAAAAAVGRPVRALPLRPDRVLG